MWWMIIFQVFPMHQLRRYRSRKIFLTNTSSRCVKSPGMPILQTTSQPRTPSNWSDQSKHRFLTQIRFFFRDELYLFKYYPDQIIRRCLPEDEHHSVLTFCHELACGGHFSPCKTAEKVLHSGFYWPTLFKDCLLYTSPSPRDRQKSRMPSSA